MDKGFFMSCQLVDAETSWCYNGFYGNEFERTVTYGKDTAQIMKYDFDHTLDHCKNGSYRWTQPYGKNNVLGMGTADMDYYCPPCLKEALSVVCEENTYNYRMKPDIYFQTIIDWYENKYSIKIEKEWLSNVPSTIGAIRLAIQLFSKKDDYVLMQTPHFTPLQTAIEGAGCHLLVNPMILENGTYRLDFQDFEDKVKAYKPSVFLLVNPQNPTGHVFSHEELSKLADICWKYHVRIISDEVHSLILYDGNKHIPILGVSEKAMEISIQIVSMCKGFNMMSLPHAIITIADKKIREAWEKLLLPYSFGYASNSFSIAGVTAVMSGKADDWLKEVTSYLQNNRDILTNTIQKKGFPISPIKPGAGHLLWIDCRKSGVKAEELGEYFLEKAGISLNNGLEHGEAGKGFVRLNFAVTKSNLMLALERIETLFK